jgi:hypothetical protein
MSGTVYALLVGINDYGGNPSPLSGCVADVDALSTLLGDRVSTGALQLESLTDQQATRQQIIDRFDAHLGRAGPGDVALFAFSGHGSYEPVEDRFWFLEPTGQNQTIVCADSRTKRVGDLADKELNELIRRVAENGPHVVVVLDCCHSGGGTRDPSALPAGVNVRLAPPVDQPRPLEDYLPAVRAAAESAARSAAASAVGPAPGLGHPRHVALSACQPAQLSKEIPIGGGHRGAFSAAFERALQSMPSTATYRDLLRAAANEVRNRVSDQDPVAFVEGEELDQPFLGGVVQRRAETITLEEDHGVWVVDVGRAHGIPEARGGEATVLTVRAEVGQPDAPREPLGQVRVTDVEPTRSIVEPIGFVPESGRQYRAVVTEVPLPPAGVEIRGDGGDGAAVGLVRSALRGSTFVCEAPSGTPTADLRFTVLTEDGRLTIAKADATPLTDALVADDAGAARTVQRLEHVARWHLVKDLTNPTAELAGQVAIELVEAGAGEEPPAAGTRPALMPDGGGVISLSYRRIGSDSAPPLVFAYLHNRSDRDLFCTLLDLTDRFKCTSELFPVEKIAAGKSAVAFGGRPIALSVPDVRLAAGGTEVRDWFKLIACEQRFEAGSFDMPNLDGVLATSRSGRQGTSVLDRLATRIATRDAGGERPDSAAEWATAIVSLLTVKSADGVEIPSEGEAQLAGGAVAVEAHPALAGARARLASSAATTRGADGRGVAPTALVRDPDVAVPLRLGSTRAVTEADPDHLELVGAIDPARVSAAHPVRVRLQVTVAPDDVVLAVARDGDLFIPLGTGARTADGSVELTLQRLPEGDPDADSTRGLTRSIRICFQRVIGRRLGLDSSWPRLAVARVEASTPDEEPMVELDHDPATVAAAVADASTVLLVVHGLLGDTRTMLPALHAAVGDRYDAVLAYDFDSIGSPVVDSAGELAERLAAVGLTAERGRRLDIVAVSTGAVVVRWFVERLGGAAVVRQAVLAGVPNRGTPWAALQGWATNLLAIGINGLAKVVWPARVLGWLVGAVERIDQGIDDLEPGSAVLAELGAPGGPAAAYTVLAGNTSLAAGAQSDLDDGRLARLLARLGRRAADRVFFRQPNDLVVTTASIRELPVGLEPRPVYVDVACDHMTYLQQPGAIAAISDALR